VYVETSALLAALLEQDASAQATIRSAHRCITSALTFAEAYRALIRARVTGRVTPDQERRAVLSLRTFAERCDVMAVTDDVLLRAGRSFPLEPIRTLDAIHLASMEMLVEQPPLVTCLTRDTRIRDNASAIGFSVA
jgi:predicted nucleic acid-binding protein